MTESNGEAGQASLLLLGVVAALLTGLVVLFTFGQALGAKGRHQRGADLAAISAAQVMSDNYARLFQPPLLPNGLPNPRHLSNAAYLALARAAARRGAARNGLRAAGVAVRFPGVGFAPTRVTVQVRGQATLRAPGDDRPRPVEVGARATAEMAPDNSGLGMPENATGGGYSGPLSYRQGKPMRPDVALAFDRMAAAARREAGLYLLITSGYRSDAEQARLFAANPDPKWVAPPGTSLHRYGTELDLGPPAAYAWLAANSERFGSCAATRGSRGISAMRGTTDRRRWATAAPPATAGAQCPRSCRRASTTRSCGRRSAGTSARRCCRPRSTPSRTSTRSPSLRPARRALPSSCRVPRKAWGLQNPFDPEEAIDAQAHLMRDLLRRFGSVPLALAAYNAGPGAVEQYGGIPPYAETRAYVAKILGLLGGAGDIAAGPGFEVRLVE